MSEKLSGPQSLTETEKALMDARRLVGELEAERDELRANYQVLLDDAVERRKELRELEAELEHHGEFAKFNDID